MNKRQALDINSSSRSPASVNWNTWSQILSWRKAWWRYSNLKKKSTKRSSPIWATWKPNFKWHTISSNIFNLSKIPPWYRWSWIYQPRKVWKNSSRRSRITLFCTIAESAMSWRRLKRTTYCRRRSWFNWREGLWLAVLEICWNRRASWEKNDCW